VDGIADASTLLTLRALLETRPAPVAPSAALTFSTPRP
jgi:hypothetical protein